MVLKFIAMALLILGVMLAYDARRITRKFFNGLGDQNEGTLGLKIIGWLFCIAGGLMIYFC